MKSFQRVTYVGWALMLGTVWFSVGCRKASPPAPPSTTFSPPAVEPGIEEVGQPKSPVEEPAPLPEPPSQPPIIEEPAPQPQPPTEATTSPQAPLGNLVAIDIELPPPAFRGTPVPLSEPHVEKPLGTARPPFFAPEGTVNLADGKPVTSSDPMPTAGEVDFVTDGAKEASDFGYLELHPGSQWVQIDLGQKSDIYAVVVWHNHADARVYRDVVVRISDDPDFIDAQTVFNNDYDNSSGLGIGPDMGYVETAEGKLIDCKGAQGRYIRFYSNGSTVDEKNHYTEVDVYGKPAT